MIFGRALISVERMSMDMLFGRTQDVQRVDALGRPVCDENCR
jgi:hypothetical protein